MEKFSKVRRKNVHKTIEPHPLDFDWRFEARTVVEMTQLLRCDGPVLALGCPSLAKWMSKNGREVLLVDRQPFHCIEPQIELDIQQTPPDLSGFKKAVIDPPWYPGDVQRWTAWAANCLVEGGEILVSIWPSVTRPSAECEYKALRSWMESWSDFSLLDYQPKYEIPLFELASEAFSQGGDLATSPRFGRLISLKIKRKPILPPSLRGDVFWIRFVFNNYQIAIRNREDIFLTKSLSQLPIAKGWIWPYVSRRAPQRDKIDVWSSRNEVAQLKGSSALIEALRRVRLSDTEVDFANALSDFPSLLEWEIPRPPYWRTHEWSHRQ